MSDVSPISRADRVAAGTCGPPPRYGGPVADTGGVDGGMCIDLPGAGHVVVNPDTSAVGVGGGATRGAVDPTTRERPLAVTEDRVGTTGVGGLLLGSGGGWPDRALGGYLRQPVECEGGHRRRTRHVRRGGPRPVLGVALRWGELRDHPGVHFGATTGRTRRPGWVADATRRPMAGGPLRLPR